MIFHDIYGIFDSQTASYLSYINQEAMAFEKLNSSDVRELNAKLEEALKSCGAYIRSVSKDGVYLVIKDQYILLIGIYGFWYVHSSLLFLEGELAVRNIHWIENEKIVAFNLYNIVHDESKRIVFHYSQKSEPVLFKSSEMVSFCD